MICRRERDSHLCGRHHKFHHARHRCRSRQGITMPREILSEYGRWPRSAARHGGETCGANATGASTVFRRRGQGNAQAQMPGAETTIGWYGVGRTRKSLISRWNKLMSTAFCTLTVRGSRSRGEIYHFKQTSGGTSKQPKQLQCKSPLVRNLRDCR